MAILNRNANRALRQNLSKKSRRKKFFFWLFFLDKNLKNLKNLVFTHGFTFPETQRGISFVTEFSLFLLK